MSITKKSFGFMPDGREVFSYLLDNGKNVKAEIINYGGAVKSLWVKDKNGEYVDVVLGYDTLEEYFDNDAFFGVLVGRCGNRIKNGKFTLNGEEYNIGVNDGKHSLHGGVSGFNKYLWDAIEIDDDKNPALTLTMTSPDGDEGYPGNLSVKVTYTLNELDGLCISYEATTDKDTIVNLTNHSYFNLNGEGSGDIKDMTLDLSCSFYTPADDDCVTTGEILAVDGAFDLRGGKKIGDALAQEHPQTKKFEGFDNNFIIDGRGVRKAATLLGDTSGIVMKLFTDAPGMQIYSGNKIDDKRECKGGKCYPKYGGICLETQNFPNAINYGHFPSPILKAGEKYKYSAEYRFLVK